MWAIVLEGLCYPVLLGLGPVMGLYSRPWVTVNFKHSRRMQLYVQSSFCIPLESDTKPVFSRLFVLFQTLHFQDVTGLLFYAVSYYSRLPRGNDWYFCLQDCSKKTPAFRIRNFIELWDIAQSTSGNIKSYIPSEAEINIFQISFCSCTHGICLI